MNWAKFRRMFIRKLCVHYLEYEDYIISIEHGERYSTFLLYRRRYLVEKQCYKTPSELLNKSRIDGKRLREIWSKILY